MKFFKNLILSTVLAATSVAAFADAAQLKLGVVNVRDLLQSTPQAQAIAKKLEKEFSVRKDEIIAVQKVLGEKTEKFQRDREILSKAERKKLEKEIIDAQRDLQKMEVEFREDGNMRQREETEALLQKISIAVNEVAKREHYDIIFHRDAAPYVSNKIDITKKVIEQLAAK